MTIDPLDHRHDDEVRRFLEKFSDDVIAASRPNSNLGEPQRKQALHPQIIVRKPSIYKIIADCANFSRLGYALPLMPDNLNKVYFNLPRHVSEIQTTEAGIRDVDLFNMALKFFYENFQDLTTELDILKVIKVPDQGGTCYIALDHKKKWLILVFKGTTSPKEWENTNFLMESVDFVLNNPWVKTHKEFEGIKVHEGYHAAIKNLSEKYHLFETLQNYREKHLDYKLVITGHSLGAALACVMGLEAQAIGWNPLCVTLGGPRIAYYSFTEKIKDFFEGEEITYQGQVGKLFDITPERITDILKDNNKLFDLDSGAYINVEHLGDVIPLVPRPFYDRPGGIPFILETTIDPKIDFDGEFWPQKLSLDANPDYVHGLKESENYAIKTNQVYDDLSVRLGDLFPDADRNEDEDDDHYNNKNKNQKHEKERTFSHRMMDFLGPSRILDIHRFYVMYNLSLELNPMKGFIKAKTDDDKTVDVDV